MKIIFNTVKHLNFIKNSTFILFLICAAILSFTEYKKSSILLLAITFFIEWKYYRCPFCKKSLDPRIKLDNNSFCNNCGEKINKNS